MLRRSQTVTCTRQRGITDLLLPQNALSTNTLENALQTCYCIRMQAQTKKNLHWRWKQQKRHTEFAVSAFETDTTMDTHGHKINISKTKNQSLQSEWHSELPCRQKRAITAKGPHKEDVATDTKMELGAWRLQFAVATRLHADVATATKVDVGAWRLQFAVATRLHVLILGTSTTGALLLSLKHFLVLASDIVIGKENGPAARPPLDTRLTNTSNKINNLLTGNRLQVTPHRKCGPEKGEGAPEVLWHIQRLWLCLLENAQAAHCVTAGLRMIDFV